MMSILALIHVYFQGEDLTSSQGPSIADLVQAETVDSLPYIGWHVDVEEEKVSDLLTISPLTS